MQNSSWRETSQHLLPTQHTPTPAGQYDVYPAFPIGTGKIQSGYAALAQSLARHERIVIDGYVGVLWQNFREQLDSQLQAIGIRAVWLDVSTAMLPEDAIQQFVEPFLGGDDPIFGTRYTGQLSDFFDTDKLRQLQPNSTQMTILYGCGATLAGWNDALLVYVEVPKNEIQFRSRAGSISALGSRQTGNAKAMYKRFYFVDWVTLNRHKATLLPKIDVMIDEQRHDAPMFMSGDGFRDALTAMSKNYFRVRPWFEPGVWGGQWMKERFPQLAHDVPNYAWSFELITPENGVLLESDGYLLEVAFEWLMYHAGDLVLGDCSERFGYEFPIRFDYLDTWDGGNLSVQCHPRTEYIQQHFGETFTQDETYYILDCKADAKVYLGFQDNIDTDTFRAQLEHSAATGEKVEIEQFVNAEAAHKHDLFLIPNGTIHCSGEGILVLEISATPYIFTFKMYDWQRLDLNGKPRPLNINRAFDNLNFERKGNRIQAELVSKPSVIAQGEDWQIVHQPTHTEHFYDVHRLEFASKIDVGTNGSFHVLNLVEGDSIMLETANGMQQRFSYAETFVVPAAAVHYRLVNMGSSPVKVIKAFMK
jgi:mannose-6-phosphate isomerase class I